MQTGWQRLGGTWYYFSASGAMQTGWQELDGAWYYFYESGDMAADTWIGDYYMGPDGKWVP
jgi:glucan-binding YG repeat protein